MPECNKCGKKILQGFFAAGNYYCNETCLSKDYSNDEWEKLHNEECDEFYWSEFDYD